MLRLLSKQNNSSLLISRYPRRFSSIASINAENNSKTDESKIQQIINADIKENNPVPVFKRALLYGPKIALKDLNGEYSYNDIFKGSYRLSESLNNLCGSKTSSRVAFLCPNNVSFLFAQWATWISGQVAVPLSSAHPSELLEYYIKDSQSNVIVSTPEYEAKMKTIAEKLNKTLHIIDYESILKENIASESVDANAVLNSGVIPDGQFYKDSAAMIVYTSGTTAKPKGVVLSHTNLDAQVAMLGHAWDIQPTDTLLHALPLHHVHGLTNALLLPLCQSAKVVMLPKFETEAVWSWLLNINKSQKDRISVFMGVPTVYNYLIQEYDKLFSKKSQMAEYIRTHCETKIRLMVSGSAPLPMTTFQRWKDITGHKLLERYGMTEIGMALSNTLREDQVRKRLPGFVGQPLPNVRVRITRPEDDKDVLLEAEGEVDKGLWSKEQDKEIASIKLKPGLSTETEIIGHLQIFNGPTVFKEYFNNPEATKKEFTEDGWFVTGDSVSYDTSLNSFKILGRISCDIIKCKGYKISALEMETKLLEHPVIGDCAVIGVPDEAHGQKIYALIALKNEKIIETPEQEAQATKELEKWCQQKFASYSLPNVKIVNKIPRNQMGKVNKADLVKEFVAQASAEPVK